MTPTPRAYDLIQRWEGFAPTWYECPAGVDTIGYGTTRPLLDDVAVADVEGKITEAEGTALLRAVVTQHFVPKLLRALDGRVPQADFDALVSFVYNVGIGAFDRSTMRRYYRKGEYEAARDEYTKWVYADGEKLDGLVARRKDEQQLARTAALPDVDRVEQVETLPPMPIEHGTVEIDDLELASA